MANISKFEIQNVERHLGYGLKKIGTNQYQGKCPYCSAEGHDNHEDNLHFNPNKGFFCGACIDNEHGKRLAQEIVVSRKETFELRKKASELEVSEETVKKCSSDLFKNKEMLELLKIETGLSEEVIKECKLGFHTKKELFILPMYALNNSLVGFELRSPENHKGKFKFISKTKGYASDITKCLSKINNPQNPTEIMICAGYKDGYAALQHLKDIGRSEDVQIVTNTNGEGNTARALEPHIDYLKIFDKRIICMDNDKAGKKAVKKIEQTIPLVFHLLNLGSLNGIDEYINDFNDLLKYTQEHKINEDLITPNIKLSLDSLINIYIKYPNTKLNLTKTVKIAPEDYNKLEFVETGIYPYKSNYYKIQYDSENHDLYYTRKSNYTFSIPRKIVFHSNTFEHETEYKLEVTTTIDGKINKSLILTQKDLLDVKNLHEVFKVVGIHLHTLNDVEIKNIILTELNNNNETLYVYKNPALIKFKGNSYWIYENAIVDLKNSTILTHNDKNDENIIPIGRNDYISLMVDKGMYAPKLFISDISYSEFVKQNTDDELIKEFADNSNSIQSLLVKCLFINTLRTYNNRSEAMLALGLAIMSPFVDIIFEKTMGFPINFMYGEAASGKSNLLITFAHLFGFDSRYLSSGNDTALNVLHNTQYYNALPILYAEVEGKLKSTFETTVKAVYDRNSRKRMTTYGKEQDIKDVNAILTFASNNRTYRNPQTATRLLYTEFAKDNFNVTEASKINNIREKYLSCLMPEILKHYTDRDSLLNNLKKKHNIILKHNPTLDLRCVNNIAIAMVGMDYLYQLAGFDEKFLQSDEIKLQHKNLEDYIKSHQDLTHTEDCFEKFLRIFLTLAKSNKIQYGSEYVFNERKKELSIYVNGVYQLFKKEFKQSEDNGSQIPDSKDIEKQALKRPYIKKNTKNFGDKKTQRALIITIPDDDEILNYILDELVKYEENLDDKQAKSVYTKEKLEKASKVI